MQIIHKPTIYSLLQNAYQLNLVSTLQLVNPAVVGRAAEAWQTRLRLTPYCLLKVSVFLFSLRSSYVVVPAMLLPQCRSAHAMPHPAYTVEIVHSYVFVSDWQPLALCLCNTSCACEDRNLCTMIVMCGLVMMSHYLRYLLEVLTVITFGATFQRPPTNLAWPLPATLAYDCATATGCAATTVGCAATY